MREAKPKKAVAPKKKAAPKIERPVVETVKPDDIASALASALGPMIEQNDRKVDIILKMVEALQREEMSDSEEGDVTLVVNRDANGLIETITVQKPKRTLN